jgi:cell division protease FtsH
MADSTQPDNANGGRKTPVPPWWFLLLTILLIWSTALLWPQTTTQAPIAYSVFLEQVRTGNVASVQITGDAISGTFKKPYEPPAATATPPADTALSASSPPTHYSGFSTVFPTTLGDPRLLAELVSRHVTIAASSATQPWMLTFAITWLPILLIGGYMVWIAGNAGRKQMGMFNGFGKVNARLYTSPQAPVTFADVAGAAEAKAELQEEVDFLRHPEKYHDLGARIPRGVLLVGAPGTGKTLLAKAVAGEAGVPFFSLNGSEFVEMFVGVGASRVRDLFTKAKASAPSIVFIDELDAVGRRRGAGIGNINDEREQTLNQLLGELDGFDPRAEVIILAATNRPDVLDPALLRPGRFDRQVTIDLPDCPDREAILTIHAHKLKLAPDVDLANIARSTIGLSGADLANLCNEAALAAARAAHTNVSMADFESAHDRLLLGAARRPLNDAERKTTAYHESGHALIAWLTADADPVQKVSIVPRGRALGQTEQLPGEERHNLTLSYLKARLAVMLGGRAAEEVALHEITTGAESDLLEATRLARQMVTRWGMGDIGLAVFAGDEAQPFLGYEMTQGHGYSEMTAARIDRNVRELLDTAHVEVRARLLESRTLLDKLAAELLQKETIGTSELSGILGPRQNLHTPFTSAAVS